MSVQTNQYLLYGLKLDYKKYNTPDNYSLFEKYEDNAFNQEININGLLCLFDGMNGDYIYIGRCFKKSSLYENIKNIDIPELNDDLKKEIEILIKSTFNTEEEIMKIHLVTHSR